MKDTGLPKMASPLVITAHSWQDICFPPTAAWKNSGMKGEGGPEACQMPSKVRNILAQVQMGETWTSMGLVHVITA